MSHDLADEAIEAFIDAWASKVARQWEDSRKHPLTPINPSEAIDEDAEYIVNPNAWNYEPIGDGWHRQTPIYRQQGPLYDAGALDREKVYETTVGVHACALAAFAPLYDPSMYSTFDPKEGIVLWKRL